MLTKDKPPTTVGMLPSDELRPVAAKILAGPVKAEITAWLHKQMASLRSGWIKGRDDDLNSLEQVLGVNGTLISQRLSVDESTSNEDLRMAATQQHQRWQRLAGNPMVSHDMQTVIDVVIRSLEGEMVRLSSGQR